MPSILSWTTVCSTFLTCAAVWGMLWFSSHRANLPASVRRRVVVISGVFLFGWWMLMFMLAGGMVFQAAPSSIRPSITIALGITLPILSGVILLQSSRLLKSIINVVPLQWLVGVQLYRVLGVTFVLLYAMNRLPVEFALPAGVGDIVIGVSAPLVGYFYDQGYRWSSRAVVIWNVVGILDLVAAVALGFLTSPSPLQLLALEAPNRLITAFPLVLVPVFAVPLSVLLHLTVLKRLLRRSLIS